MGRKALADGIQIENGGAQGGDIVHLGGDTLEIAPVEIVIEDLALTVGGPLHFLVPILVDGVGPELAGEIAAAFLIKPIREHLIDGGTLGPIGSGEIRRDAANLPPVTGLHIGRIPFLEEPEAAVGLKDPEMVKIQAAVFQCEAAAEDLIHTLILVTGHGYNHLPVCAVQLQDAFHRHGAYGGRNMDVQAALLTGCQGAEGFFVAEFLGIK